MLQLNYQSLLGSGDLEEEVRLPSVSKIKALNHPIALQVVGSGIKLLHSLGDHTLPSSDTIRVWFLGLTGGRQVFPPKRVSSTSNLATIFDRVYEY